MSKRSTFAKGALAITAGVMALGAAASPVLAQPAGAYSAPYGGGYDPCQREANNRGVGGALVGGGIGAVMGSQMAASGHRTDGSVLGGVVGAIAGSMVGHSSAACGTAPPPAPTAYNDLPPPPPPPAAYVEREPRYRPHYRVAEGPALDRDGCTVADSVVYMPDGATAHRPVRVCADPYGRFHIAD